ncbi:hypothetical protein [Sphingobium sp. Leaf26]|uniref:hypothetical protein n=1 Tax=Sphingobium sp. Leaf26 TaxID=1735693 RepID=UPI000A69B9A2|nr:hypothetical protein [Sphingobium sp. Leaf26]
MELGQGFPEWTELGQDSGLDPLGMQRPIEAIYQSLVPGISTITLRYRYYSFFPLILRHYEEKIRHPDPAVLRSFQRKCEALFALICTHGEPELGITGSDWAGRTLNEVTAQSGASGIIDFTVGADPDADEKLRYLKNKGGAFGAIYSTQMSEMGLVHFPDPGQSNPNPVCSEVALQLAEALASELGDIADRFFEVVASGQISVSDLGSFAAMKPSALQSGSREHVLLKDILLGATDTRGLTAQMRRSTLRMLLEFTNTFDSVPRAETVKWHWFENVPAKEAAEPNQVPQLWFLYQACDLMRLAYEVILSAALTLIEAAPRRRMSLGELTDDLAGAVPTTGGESWDDFSTGINAAEEASTAREYAAAMLEAMDTGETSEQVRNAISLIAILADKATAESSLVEAALSGADYFQSLRTEAIFLDRNRSADADRVIADLIRERVLKRHLWVASRKFRNQKAYTFHMEPEEGALRYRAPIQVSPSSPRLDQALRFLRDISLIDSGGITSIGRSELAVA